MKAWRTGIGACCLAVAMSTLAAGVEVSLVPIRATGTHWFVGDTIVLDGVDQAIILEIRVGPWDPAPWTCIGDPGAPNYGEDCVVDLDDPLYPQGLADCPWTDPWGDQDSWCGMHLKAWQVAIKSSTYSNGTGTDLAPWAAPCSSHTQCANLIQSGSLCNQPGMPPFTCTNAFIDILREGYVFNHPNVSIEVPAADYSTLDYRLGSTIATGTPVPPQDQGTYLGTLALYAGTGAQGTYTVNLKPDPDTSLTDQYSFFMEPLDVIPAVISIACQTNDDCDDGNECTDDVCEVDQTCSNTLNYDDSVYCCDPTDGTLTEIDDQNECTEDVCHPEDGSVTHDPVMDGTDCDDEDACNVGEECLSGVCTGGAPVDCSGRGDQCNNASCDPLGEEGNCDILTPVENGTPCDDGDACNLGEACQDGSCTGGAPPDCAGFGDQCNVASCDPGGEDGNCDTITQEPDDTPCDDEDSCNIGEACQSGACTGGGPVDCSAASDQCNEASCDSAGDEGNCDTITPLPDGTPCDDGDPCTGTGRPGIPDDACDGVLPIGSCIGVWDELCNDDCEYAVEVFVGANTGNNDNRGPDDAEASVLCVDDSNNDVWFVFTPICSGEIFASTTGSTFTPSNDPVLSVWDACPGDAGVEIACDDDSGVDLQAALVFTADPGATYWFRVAGFEDNSGDIVLNISMVNDCLIDGACYSDGAINPTNECEACIPEASTSSWSPRLEGTPCGDDGDTECDNPDACDGAGVCETNPKPDGTECSDDGNECTDDYCIAGACAHPDKTAGTPCGSDNDTQCDDPDTCDGSGDCLDNHEPDDTPCDDQDPCTGTDVCVTGVCVGTPPLAPGVDSMYTSRRLFITPVSTGAPDPVALSLTSPTWTCLSKYVGADGLLVDDPVYQMAGDWGTVMVYGPNITPSFLWETTIYHVSAECGAYVSAPGADSMERWGDIGGMFDAEQGVWGLPDGRVDIFDMTAIVDAFGWKSTAPPLIRSDIAPCTPDDWIDIHDMVHVVDAFGGRPYDALCPFPCP